MDTRNAANISFDGVKAIRSCWAVQMVPIQSLNVLDMAVCLSAEMLAVLRLFLTQRSLISMSASSSTRLSARFRPATSRGGNVREVEICQSVVLDALSALEERRNDIPRAASLAKARLSDASRLITNEGVQMHGGIGMTDAVDVGLFLKRAGQAQMLGDANFHRSRYADSADTEQTELRHLRPNSLDISALKDIFKISKPEKVKS